MAIDVRGASRRLVVSAQPGGSGGSLELSLIECESDPPGLCSTPFPQGCAPSLCTVSVACDQPNAAAVAAAIVQGFNQAVCPAAPGVSAVDEGDGKLVLTYPDGLCLCVFDISVN